MKILIVGPTFYPDVNGASYFVQRLAHYLHKNGHSVLVVAPSRFIHNENYDLNGVSVFGVRSFPIFINRFRVAQSIFIKNLLRKKIKEFSPDVIHLQSHLIFSKTILEIARELKIPIMGTNHFMPENLLHYLHLNRKTEGHIRQFAWKDFLKVFEKLDAVTTPTETGAKLLAEIGLSKSVVPISCGIDLKIFNTQNNGEYLKEKYNLPKKQILLYLGRLDKEKNVDVLLRAFALSLEKIDAHFLIAGFGAEKANLEKLASKLKIKKSVTFTGFVSNEDKPNLYRVADCFAIAGVAELQSIVTMEAMASGLPVIAVNAMALPHLIKHGENGFLFQLDDIKSISEYIVRIFSDKELKNRMSKKSLEMIKVHDIDKIIDKYELLYHKIINRQA
jgi:glycosyltransferase involved in cell wall biosynthesis